MVDRGPWLTVGGECEMWRTWIVSPNTFFFFFFFQEKC